MSRDGAAYRVPKRDLVGVLQVLLQSRRLKIADAIPEARLLVQEMLAFRAKITTNAHETRTGHGVRARMMIWSWQWH
jgi:hypothetical protein